MQEYYRILFRRIAREIWQFGTAQVIVILVAIATLALQMKYGVLRPGDFWPSITAVILPYLGLAFLFVLYQSFRVPKLLHEEQGASFAGKEGELNSKIKEQEQVILGLQPAKRTKAEQHAFDTVEAALKVVKDDGITALRHLKYQGKVIDGMYRTGFPDGMKPEKVIWVYQHCQSIGIVNRSANISNNEITYTISSDLAMQKALDELLFAKD